MYACETPVTKMKSPSLMSMEKNSYPTYICEKKMQLQSLTLIEDFKNLLSQESWEEVVDLSDVNASLKAFLDIFLYFFNITFPYKRIKLKKKMNKRWLSKGLIISSNRMNTLKHIKKNTPLRKEI
jgi:hypothetical protein